MYVRTMPQNREPSCSVSAIRAIKISSHCAGRKEAVRQTECTYNGTIKPQGTIEIKSLEGRSIVKIAGWRGGMGLVLSVGLAGWKMIGYGKHVCYRDGMVTW